MRNIIDYKMEDIINLPNLFSSFYSALNGVMWKENVARAANFDDYFVNGLYNDFIYNDWNFPIDNLFHTIINERGKERLICSNTFKDRVVLKCFNQNFLLPCFQPRFIYDNGASQLGKGVDFALDRVEQFLHNAFINYGPNFYFLKLDVRHYFDTIWHPYILSLISQFTSDYRVMRYFENNLKQFQYNSFINEGSNLPQGVGLGSECDQTFGLIDLNKMDHIIKEDYHIKYMERYMDDIIIIHNDLLLLEDLFEDLKYYLAGIHQSFNAKKSYISPISQGILFLKIHFYVSNTGKIHRQVYGPNVRRAEKKFKSLAKLYREGKIMYTDVEQSVNSTIGSLQRADCEGTINKLLYDLQCDLDDEYFPPENHW